MHEPEFRCAMCGGTFRKASTDDEAIAEYREHFPTAAAANVPTATICDDCWFDAGLDRARG